MNQLKKLEKIENLFSKILELYKNLEKKQDLTLKLLSYLIDKDEVFKEAKKNKDYVVLDFLLN